MKAKHLFVVFSVIGWSIALAALYQWSQPSGQPAIESHQPVPSASSNQMDRAMQYFLPPESHKPSPFNKTPYKPPQQPYVVEI